jgi:hypothetical protein
VLANSILNLADTSSGTPKHGLSFFSGGRLGSRNIISVSLLAHRLKFKTEIGPGAS